jgi:hypothetical protein
MPKTRYARDTAAYKAIAPKLGYSPDSLRDWCQQAGRDAGQRSASDKLIHHCDRGSQYLSVQYIERLAGAGIVTSVGSVGDVYDNAPAENVIGLFKTKVIKVPGPWKSVSQIQWETLKWVNWYNNTRLHSAIGYITPQEAQETFYASLNDDEKAAQSLNQKLAGKPGAARHIVSQHREVTRDDQLICSICPPLARHHAKLGEGSEFVRKARVADFRRDPRR